MAVAEELNSAGDGGAVGGMRGIRLPWAALVVAAIALAIAAWPSASEALIYDRTKVLRGEWWRLFTGHWVHFSASHLWWNLAVLVPAGAWVERLVPARARVLFGLAPVVIGVVLFAADPALQQYAGLSGVAAGVLALLALTQLAAGAADRWFWWAVLGLIAVKIVAELMFGQPALARFADTAIRPVPLAHLAGVACGSMVHFRWRGKKI